MLVEVAEVVVSLTGVQVELEEQVVEVQEDPQVQEVPLMEQLILVAAVEEEILQDHRWEEMVDPV